jgi:hypothetical protein
MVAVALERWRDDQPPASWMPIDPWRFQRSGTDRPGGLAENPALLRGDAKKFL